MDWKLKGVKQITDKPWVNLFEVSYDRLGKEINWIFASRNSINNVFLKTKNLKPDSVAVVPRLVKDNTEYLVMIKEFRPVLNEYIYSFPAGLVEDNESEDISAIREVKEEIGADVTNLTRLTGTGFNTEGLCDESTSVYLADIVNLGEQNLKDNEDIERVIVCVDDIQEFLKDKLFSAKAELFLNLYYNLKVKDHTDNKTYKFVKDINDYIEFNLKQKNMDDFWVKKINNVKARAGIPGEKVTTILVDGTVEVSNVVKVDDVTGMPDYVVTNSFGEEYVVDYNTFKLKYSNTDIEGIYAPISNPIRAVRVNENIEFESAFKKLFKVNKDDYLIIPPNRNIYGITKESLYENYTFVKE